GGDEADAFSRTEVGRELLEQGVRMGRVANFERTVGAFLADTVEDDDAAGPLQRNEARELVDELTRVREGPGVQEVVAVEQIKGRGSHGMEGYTYITPLGCRRAS